MTQTTNAQLPPLALNAWLRWDVVRAVLPPPDRSTRVLEVGCGQGGFGARLAQRYTYLGVELDESSASVAAGRVAAAGGGGEVRHQDVDDVEGTFDLVCAFEVIEHIEDDHAAVAAWAERLRPGGLLVLSTPAGPDRFSAWDEMVGHYRRYDEAGMQALLRGAGLEGAEVTHFGAPLGYALEAARNAIGRRRLGGGSAASGDSGNVEGSMAERTSASGRTLQPTKRAAALATRAGTYPFRVVQRAFPARGTGMVAVARKPR